MYMYMLLLSLLHLCGSIEQTDGCHQDIIVNVVGPCNIETGTHMLSTIQEWNDENEYIIFTWTSEYLCLYLLFI